jgi:hypothetical protein
MSKLKNRLGLGGRLEIGLGLTLGSRSGLGLGVSEGIILKKWL